MTDLLNLIKEKADEFLATINQKGGVRATIEGLRRQMAEADRRRAMGRVKSELRRLDRQISEMITAVGVQAVALQEAGKLTSPELQPLCQHIIDLKAALSQQQAELAALEASAGQAAASESASPAPPAAATPGFSPCANCGRPVPAGGAFCPYCGAAVVAAPTRPTTLAQEPITSAAEPASPPSPTPTAPAPAARSETARPETAAPMTSPPASPAPAAPATPTVCAYCGAALKPGARFCSKCGRAT